VPPLKSPKSVKKTKLLLIYPSQLYAPAWGGMVAVKPHLMSLFSFLYKAGVDIRMLDLENELGRPENKSQVRRFKEKASGLIAGFDFDIAAISCYTSLNYLSSVMAARLCKKTNPDCRVVVGGYHPSALPKDFMYAKSPFDFIVKGEGERALADICKGKTPKDKHPHLIQGAPLNLQNNLRLRWKEYGYLDPNRNYYLYLSRGCPFNCAFCSESCKGHPGWRALAPAKAADEIRRLIDFNHPRRISVSDACFGFNPRWRRSFLKRLDKTNINSILGLECRVDTLEKKDIDLLSRFKAIVTMGLESGSPRMIKILQKSANPKLYLKKCRDALCYMNKRKLSYIIYLVFNHPGETRSTYAETIAFLESIVQGQESMSGYIIAQNYAFFPGSHTFRHINDHKRRYGTTVAHPAWWKEPENHSQLAREITASNDLDARTKPGNFWDKDILNLNLRIFKKMPPGIRAIWREVYQRKPVPGVLIPDTIKTIAYIENE